MKRKLAMIVAAASLAMAAPVMAENHADHTGMKHDAQCERDCALLLKDCKQEVDSIQERIAKLQAAIKKDGANTYTRDELKRLDKQLKDAIETLRVLNKH